MSFVVFSSAAPGAAFLWQVKEGTLHPLGAVLGVPLLVATYLGIKRKNSSLLLTVCIVDWCVAVALFMLAPLNELIAGLWLVIS